MVGERDGAERALRYTDGYPMPVAMTAAQIDGRSGGLRRRRCARTQVGFEVLGSTPRTDT